LPSDGRERADVVFGDDPGELLSRRPVGDAVYVAGTTATDETGTAQHPGDAVAQAGYVMQKVESALREAGATLADIARTRVFVHNVEDSEAVARVHGSVFADVRPANTLLRGEPIDAETLVEIEVDAVVSPRR